MPLQFDPSALGSYELAARIGEPSAPDGETEVLVRGDGILVARQHGQHDERVLEARAQLSRDQVEFLVRSATQFDWNDRFPARPGIPDEPIVHWSMTGPGGESAQTRMWLRDVERGSMTGKVLALLRELLDRASDGRMFL